MVRVVLEAATRDTCSRGVSVAVSVRGCSLHSLSAVINAESELIDKAPRLRRCVEVRGWMATEMTLCTKVLNHPRMPQHSG